MYQLFELRYDEADNAGWVLLDESEDQAAMEAAAQDIKDAGGQARVEDREGGGSSVVFSQYAK